MAYGVDYSYDHPTTAQLKAAGKVFACRYLTGSGAKRLTLTEVQDLVSGGISLVANFESTAGFLLGGYDVGRSVAKTAWAAAMSLGMPDNRPIYYSLDLNATYDQYKVARETLKGTASVHGVDNNGMYGGLVQVQWAHEDGVAPWVWQTYAWSYGQLYDKANLYQYKNGVVLGDGTVDLNRSLTPDFGQWGIDMPLTDADKPIIKAALAEWFGNGVVAGQTKPGDSLLVIADHVDKGRTENRAAFADLKSVVQTGGINVTALASDLRDILGPDLANDLVTAIKALNFRAA
jgi:Domain of unknown function (DUF1906)